MTNSPYFFTAGPWQVNHRDKTQVCDSDGEVRGCSPIAYCEGSMGERTANARLIAAAPDLLAALESFLRAPSVGSAGPGSVTLAVQEFNLRAAKAAVAKATGRAP